jgi:hypothetical protein
MSPLFDYRDREATNQTIFREMNEWTLESSVAVLEDREQTFLCECSDPKCSHPIQLTLAEYEAVRAVPIRFAIAVNHENPEIDRLVAENPRYAIVEKMKGGGADIARVTDPRR